MPSRIVRDGILYSVPVSNLTPLAELFFRKLLSVSDDFGRFHAGPPILLISLCYPLQSQNIKPEDINKWLKELAKQGLIKIYTVEGTPFLEVRKFRQRRRASKSKFPDDPTNCNTDDGHVPDASKTADSRVTPEDEYEDENENESEKKKCKLPKGWEPTEVHEKMAKKEGVNLKRAAEIFRNWADGGGQKRVNWNLTFSNALLNEDWMKKQAPAKKMVSADGTETKRIKIN